MKECTPTSGRRSRAWVIIGPGSLGILFGARLFEAGFPVTFQIKAKEKLSSYQKEGLILQEGGEEKHIRPQFFPCGTPPPVEPEVVLLTVKSYDTRSALDPLLVFLKQDVRVLTLQNGLTPLEELRGVLKPERIALGVTTEGAQRIEFNVARRAGIGRTWVGAPFAKVAEDLLRIVHDLREAGFDALFTEEITRYHWTKLLVSLSVNPITAISGLPNRAILDTEWGKSLLKSVIYEAVSLLNALSVDLTFEEALSFVIETIESTRDNRSSMLQDLEMRRPTEIEAIAGAFIRKAKGLGKEVPTIEALYSLVRLREESLGIPSL